MWKRLVCIKIVVLSDGVYKVLLRRCFEGKVHSWKKKLRFSVKHIKRGIKEGKIEPEWDWVIVLNIFFYFWYIKFKGSVCRTATLCWLILVFVVVVVEAAGIFKHRVKEIGRGDGRWQRIFLVFVQNLGGGKYQDSLQLVLWILWWC